MVQKIVLKIDKIRCPRNDKRVSKYSNLALSVFEFIKEQKLKD